MCLINTYENKTSNTMLEGSTSKKNYNLKKRIDIEISEKKFWIEYILSGSVDNCKQTIFHFRPQLLRKMLMLQGYNESRLK
jgi:hypothetical protein